MNRKALIFALLTAGVLAGTTAVPSFAEANHYGRYNNYGRNSGRWSEVRRDRRELSRDQAELARDRTGIDLAALVGRGGLPGHDLEARQRLQPRRQVLDDAVGEMLLRRIVAHVREGQDDDRAGMDAGRQTGRGRRCRASVADDLKAPREQERHGKTEHQQDGRKSDRPRGEIQRGQDDRGDLDEQPSDNRIGGGHAEDLAFLKFRHPGHGREG